MSFTNDLQEGRDLLSPPQPLSLNFTLPRIGLVNKYVKNEFLSFFLFYFWCVWEAWHLFLSLYLFNKN